MSPFFSESAVETNVAPNKVGEESENNVKREVGDMLARQSVHALVNHVDP
jgi:hypothetical protein